MRLAYVCTDPGVPVFGRKGCSIHVQEVIRALRVLGVQVELFTVRPGGIAPLDLADVTVHRLPVGEATDQGGRERALTAANPVWRELIEGAGPFDVVYERYSLWSHSLMEWARDRGLPALLEVNAPLVEEQERHRGLVDAALARELSDRAFAAASALLAVSREVAAHLESQPSARGRVAVVPNGVDATRFDEALRARARRRASGGALTVGFVGTLKPWHGTEDLVTAFGMLAATLPSARLMVVGEGPERERLEALAARVGVESRTSFVGAVAPESIPSWLGGMDIAVAPYPRLDQFYFSPLKVYEYMAAGAAVVASRIGQLDELLEDGVTARLVESGNVDQLAAALKELAADAGLRSQLGRNARAQVEQRHTWVQVAEAIRHHAQGPLSCIARPAGGGVVKSSVRLSETLRVLWRVGRRFGARVKEQRGLLVGAVAAMVAEVMLRLIEPWALKIVFDALLFPGERTPAWMTRMVDTAGREGVLVGTCVVVIAIACARAGSAYASTIGFAQAGGRVLSKVRADLFRHLQCLPLAFHHRSRGGDLVLRVIHDVGQLQDVLVTAMVPLCLRTAMLVGMVALMFTMNVRLAFCAVALLPLFWLRGLRLNRGIHEVARRQRRREGEMAATAAESLGSVTTVQALSLESRFSGAFDARNANAAREDVQGKRLSAKLERSVDVFIAGASAVVLWQGTHLVWQGTLTPGDLLVFLAYLKTAFRPLQDSAKYSGRLAKAAAAGERVLAVLDERAGVVDAADAVAAPVLRGGIRFEDVTFLHSGMGDDSDEGRGVRGVTLDIAPRQWIALVGASGSGKSTLLSLVSRLHDPHAGRVCIDGIDVKLFTVASVRSQVSVVLQDTGLFAGTVLENIRAGREDASLEDARAAARLANAEEFIERLPQGYETRIGERGVTLSQGQRQRIAIARAALRKSPILLLDEPTAGLDDTSAQWVMEGVRRLSRESTVILATHQAREAELADVMVTLSEGRVTNVRRAVERTSSGRTSDGTSVENTEAEHAH